MRFVYINDRCVAINIGCGFFPLRKCPVQVWASKNDIQCKKVFVDLLDCEIHLVGFPEQESSAAQQLQEICNTCKHGDMQMMKQKVR